MTEAETDDGIGAVFITGAGERPFPAGADVHENREFVQELRDAAASRAGPVYLAHGDLQQAHYRRGQRPLLRGRDGVLATSIDFLICCEKSSFRFLAVYYGQFSDTWSQRTAGGLGP